MAAGTRSWAVYTADDHGTLFGDPKMATLVPTEYTGALNVFGYTLVADAGASIDTMDQRCKPRHVVGVSADGHRSKAVVASLAAPLWTGAEATWTDTKGTTFTVTGFVGEKRTRSR